MSKSIDFSKTSIIKLSNDLEKDYLEPENNFINNILNKKNIFLTLKSTIKNEAFELIENIRQNSKENHLDALLNKFSLSTSEGTALMCLAESLLRIPDKKTAQMLIAQKLNGAKWQDYIEKSNSLFVNASTFGLLITGKIVKTDQDKQIFKKIIHKLGEPIARNSMYTAMKFMGKKYVVAEDIKKAIKNSKKETKKGYLFSYDMLGEAAITEIDAQKYIASYKNAIQELGKEKYPNNQEPTLSIKLSALYPRYETLKKDQVKKDLKKILKDLLKIAKKNNIGLQLDAEESSRANLFLDLFKELFFSSDAKNWGKLGIVVQAYAKWALTTLKWLNEIAKEQNTKIPVRLVKGAYWDSEIKICQEKGFSNYPVFTSKANTDLNYLYCAQFLCSDVTKGYLTAQFASHNVHTIISVINIAKANKRHIEMQKLWGMGDDIYDNLIKKTKNVDFRIYAPVGPYKELLPYLVRRLLENGANSSFLNKLTDKKIPIEDLIACPVDLIKQKKEPRNSKINLPKNIYPNRKNSKGINLDLYSIFNEFNEKLVSFENIIHEYQEQNKKTQILEIFQPQNQKKLIGRISLTDLDQIENIAKKSSQSFYKWQEKSVQYRCSCLEKLADLVEENIHELISLCVFEAGKTIEDSIDEIREAVDFCRYYAKQGEIQLQKQNMPSPTGETNELIFEGRGVFLCISPWNFPLAIFLGQIAAALVCGNGVIAKPALQTNLIAHKTASLCYQAGIDKGALTLVFGDGKLGQKLTQSKYISGVCFTGSTKTAQQINITLAKKNSSIVPFIAETGGQNAMIVDSTALLEQAAIDIIASAFKSAGQRCSALRVLYIQEDIKDRLVELIKGHMQLLDVGLPENFATDIGPIISQNAKDNLLNHVAYMKQQGKKVFAPKLDLDQTKNGFFISPALIEIENISVLKQENFGPILHVISYKKENINQVIEQINSTNFGLTFGIHSRNTDYATSIAKQIKVGNVYINRNQIGAMVGTQPFGGKGLSGTGPKAGGPNYLFRFLSEKVITNNTTAIGGNATLLSQN